MAKLTRVYQKIFGSSASAGQIGVFGSLGAGSPATTTDPATAQSLSQWLSGWFSAVVGANSPAMEDMNSVFFVAFRQLAYLFQAGVAEYDSTTVYYKGSLVNDGNGVIYRSLTDNNSGNALTSGANWMPIINGITAVSTTYTALSTDDVIIGDTTSAGFTVTLPAVASSKFKRYTIKNIGANTLTVQGNAAETIDGANTYALTSQYDSITLICNGSVWYVI